MDGGQRFGFGPEFDGSDTFSMDIPPGDVIVECGRREVGAPSGNAVSVHLLDPQGLWHEESPVCGADVIEWNPDQPPFYYTHDNPFPEAVFRTLPGLRPDDEVSFAGYPEGSTGRSPVIVRDGEVIGLFDLSTYDQRTFLLNGIFCASSGVGRPARRRRALRRPPSASRRTRDVTRTWNRATRCSCRLRSTRNSPATFPILCHPGRGPRASKRRVSAASRSRRT